MQVNKCFIVNSSNITEKKIEVNDMPEINNQPNDGYSMGLVYMNESDGNAVRLGKIEPDGYLAPHRANGAVYVYFVSGSGCVGIVDKSGMELTEIRVKAGDEVVFTDPMELHYYKAEENGLEYRVIGF